MSLDFSFKACAKLADGRNVYDHPNDPEQWHPVAHHLSMITMVIGLREITPSNYKKFAERLSLYQAVTGPLIRYGDGVDAYITDHDVMLFIGMRTNSSVMTDAQWAKHIIEIASRYPVSNDKRRPLPPEYVGKSAYDICSAQAAKYPKQA